MTGSNVLTKDYSTKVSQILTWSNYYLYDSGYTRHQYKTVRVGPAPVQLPKLENLRSWFSNPSQWKTKGGILEIAFKLISLFFNSISASSCISFTKLQIEKWKSEMVKYILGHDIKCHPLPQQYEFISIHKEDNTSLSPQEKRTKIRTKMRSIISDKYSL